MKNLFVAAALAASLIAAPVQAQTALMRSGPWTIALTSDRSICAMMGSANGAEFTMAIARDTFFFDIARSDLNLRVGQKVDLAVTIGGNSVTWQGEVGSKDRIVIQSSDFIGITEAIDRSRGRQGAIHFDIKMPSGQQNKHLIVLNADAQFMEAFNGLTQCSFIFQ
jgi:hypothetical protein